MEILIFLLLAVCIMGMAWFFHHEGWKGGYRTAWNEARRGDKPPPIDDSGGTR